MKKEVIIPLAKEKPPQAIIGIVGIDEDKLAQLSSDYPDIEFAVVDPSTQTLRVLAQDDSGVQAEIPQFRIDMSPKDLESNINNIVKYVRRAAFIQQYPYEAGLDPVSINKMKKEKLQDTLITLKMILSPETVIDNRIDTILSRNFTAPALTRNENIAMESRVEAELFKNLSALKTKGLIPEKQAVVYDLRDVPENVFLGIIPAIKRGAEADKNVYMCLIDPGNRLEKALGDGILPANITHLTDIESGKPIIGQARDFLLSKLQIEDFPLASISVVTTESKSEDYMEHIQDVAVEKANFVITGSALTDPKDPETEHILNMLPAMALMSIVKRYSSEDKRANIIAVDCSESILTKIRLITDIVLMAITRLNINDEITDEISAIILTARSV